MPRTTTSPSSSTTSRNTPWVAGCCGPMFSSRWSPPSSGSASATAAPADAPRGTRIGRPRTSRPGVASSNSTVRLLTPALPLGLRDHAPPPPRQPLAHVFRQLVVRIRNGQLVHGVVRLRVGTQRLAYLLGARKAPAPREALPERVPLGVGLPHENPPKVRMAAEAHAEHVVDFALEPVGAGPNGHDGIDLEPSLGHLRIEPVGGAPLQREQLVDHLARSLGIAILARR